MRVVVGMSGGVDSSVAAALLKRQGHEVIGVFMNNWEEKDAEGVCASRADWEDVMRVCDKIGVAYYSVNFAKQYMERVFSHFLAEYRAFRTPNPDVLCNREIKFGALLEFADKLGADALATGHFANVADRRGKRALLRAKDENKDQTYFLYMLTQRQLARAMFPTGNYTKAEIREIARREGLSVSDKRDSTGVCFIGERNFREFLKGYLPAQPGDIVDETGKKLGRHEGLMYYTPGQRRGLGIGGDGRGEGRWFVITKNVRDNLLVVSRDERKLFTGATRAIADTWIAGDMPAPEFECMARLRHRQPLQKARVRAANGFLDIEFESPQRAVTPGQAIVFYICDECIGGATIK